MYVTTFDKTDSKINLSEISSDAPKDLRKEDAEQQIKALGQEMFELQELLWGARNHAVLIVLQGMDTSGKDGAIKNVAGFLNPRGVSVVSFGVPTKEETEHDFLWRIHRHAPRRGEWTLFNRSHYEDVLVVRVDNLCPESMWRERFGHIRDFEELLHEHNTIVLKFFLHISKDEQKKRLLEREQDDRTAWKLNVGDWETRQKWKEYQDAYEDALRKTSTQRAPWHIVPADQKWFRNVAIAEAIVERLRPYKKVWRKQLDDVGQAAKTKLATYRASQQKE
ncbi:MAG TPA: polyphosphate kinase 2 family protein [Pseudomonadota bacterium]|nr:polyphosphate kinase 2 family protein [Pseudomonadota bacterium]